MNQEYICEYTRSEEIVNSVTHGAGVVLSFVGLVVLVAYAALYGNAMHIVTYSVFGFSMILLYLASTLYHSVRNPRLKYLFKKLDHSAIYILIAGTYTPFTLVHIKGFEGWLLFSVIWSLTVAGIIFKFTCISRFKKLSSAIYIAMGWLCIFSIGTIIEVLTPEALKYLVLGGVFYTAGVIFYAWKSLKFNHGIWHIFVISGSLLHFFAVFQGLAAFSG
ncbi:MAG: PAQR family membrane homeostasis protein TrhA [Thermodesulfobacteriota bacterium]